MQEKTLNDVETPELSPYNYKICKGCEGQFTQLKRHFKRSFGKNNCIIHYDMEEMEK
jgi:hypothetical protein